MHIIDSRYSSQFSESMLAKILSITDLEDVQSANEAVEAYEGPRVASGPSKEVHVKEVCADLLASLPPPYSPFSVFERLKALGSLRPIVIFLRQEVERISRLLEITKTVLEDLIHAMDGKITLNDSLREAMDSIHLSKIPPIWLRVGEAFLRIHHSK